MFDLPMFGGGAGENLWDEPDIVLSYIVTALVNGMGLEIGVTLMARGLVVSGTLTSERNYLEQISNVLMNQVQFTDESVPEDVRESLKALLDLRSLSEFDADSYLPGAGSISMGDEGDEDESDDNDFDDMDDFDEDDMDIVDLPPTLQYLHLKDPIIVAGEPPINFGEGSDVMVRLRLTTIDGWMLGKISPDMTNYIDFDDNGTKH